MRIVARIELQHQRERDRDQHEKPGDRFPGRDASRRDGPVARALHERIEVAIGEIVDHAARRAHRDGAEHEDHEHLRRGMRVAGDPHGPQHRPEQQPDADRAMQARDLDEIANAMRVAKLGQPRVRRRRGEVQFGEGVVSHWRASYTRGGVQLARRVNSMGMRTCAGCARPFTSCGRNSAFPHGVARGVVETVEAARTFDLDLRGTSRARRRARAAPPCRVRACGSTRADTRAPARARSRRIRPPAAATLCGCGCEGAMAARRLPV